MNLIYIDSGIYKEYQFKLLKVIPRFQGVSRIVLLAVATLSCLCLLTGCDKIPIDAQNGQSASSFSSAPTVVDNASSGCPENIKTVVAIGGNTLERVYLGSTPLGTCRDSFLFRDPAGAITRSGNETSIFGLWSGQSFSPKMAEYILPVLQGKTLVARFTGVWGATGLNKSTFEYKDNEIIVMTDGQKFSGKKYTYTEEYLDGKGDNGRTRFKGDYVFLENKYNPSAPIYFGTTSSVGDISVKLSTPISLEFLEQPSKKE